MEFLGLQGLLVQHRVSMEVPTEIAPLWQWVIMEPFSHRLMVPHGLQGLLKLQVLFMESPTETASSWQWEYPRTVEEPSIPLQMESHGLQELQVHRTISMESSPSEAQLPFSLGKASQLLLL